MRNLVVAIKIAAHDFASGPLKVVTDNVKKSSLIMEQAYSKANNTLSAGLGRARDLSVVGQTMLGVSRTMFQALGAIAESGKEYESALSRLRAATNSTKATISMLGLEARTIGPIFGYNAAEAVNGLTELGKAGMSAEQSAKALPGLLSLARAGYMEVADAATFGADAMSSFGLQAKDFSHISDVMVAAADASTIGVSDLAETFKYTSAVAKLVGASIEDTAAMTALLGSKGIKGSMAGTAMKQIYTQLANPKKAEQLKLIGVNTLDKKGNMRSMPLILDEIAKKMDSMKTKWGSGQKLAFMQAIFDTRAAPAALNLMRLGSKGIEEMIQKVNRSGIAAAKAKIILDNVEGSQNKMNQSIDNMKIAVFEQMAPMLTKIYERLSAIAQKIQLWVSKNPGLTKFAVGLFAIIAAVVGVTAVLVIVIATIVVLHNVLLAGKVIIAGYWAALATTPIGWILLGIGLLIAAVALIIKNWRPIAGFFKRLWAGISSGFSIVWGVIKKLLSTRIGIYLGAVLLPFITYPALIIIHWKTIVQWFKTTWDKIKSIFSNAVTAIKRYFSKRNLGEWFGPLGYMLDPIIKNWEKFKRLIGTVFDSAKRFVANFSKIGFGTTGSNPTSWWGRAGRWLTEDLSAPKPSGKPIQTSRTVNETRNRVDIHFNNMPKGTRVDARNAGPKVRISGGMNNAMAR